MENNLAEVITNWINQLDARIKKMEEQMTAMQQANNQLADIAFDENRFTQQLLEKVDDTARETAKEELESRIDDIAREVPQYIDSDDICERVMDTLDVTRLAREVADTNTFTDRLDDKIEQVLCDSNILNGDEVDEAIDNYITNNNILNTDEVEETIGDYIERNYDMVQKGELHEILEDTVHRLIGESLAGFQEELIKAIATRLVQTPVSTPSNGAAAHVNFPQTSLQEGGNH